MQQPPGDRQLRETCKATITCTLAGMHWETLLPSLKLGVPAAHGVLGLPANDGEEARGSSCSWSLGQARSPARA
jgi:hypothetical protein